MSEPEEYSMLTPQIVTNTSGITEIVSDNESANEKNIFEDSLLIVTNNDKQ